METIFGLSTTAQLVLAPIIAFAILAFCFGVVPAIMDRKKSKKSPEDGNDAK